MEKEKNKSNPSDKRGPELCPLCNISEETLKRLREGGKNQKTKEKSDKK